MKTFIVFFLLSSMALAREPQPEELVDYSNVPIETATITWIRVDNVTQACNNKRMSRGKPPYGNNVLGCSFWDDVGGEHQCIIITGKLTSYMTIAHENLHCHMGNFHQHED